MIWKIHPHYQLLRNISLQTLTYHVFLPIILWEIDIALLYMHGLEIIVVVLTMIFLETMFVTTLYVYGVVWWRMPTIFSFLVSNILVKDRFSMIQLRSSTLNHQFDSIWKRELEYWNKYGLIQGYLQIYPRLEAFLIKSLTLLLKLIFKKKS